MVISLLFFFCTGFVPLTQYPSWIRPVVERQPMRYAVEAMRGLPFGGPVATPILGTLFWSVGIVAVRGAPMVIGYRNASTHRDLPADTTHRFNGGRRARTQDRH